MAMRYFWASFTLQIIVYALLSHVIVKYWSDTEVLGLSILGILLFLPFTIMLINKFKSIARIKLSNITETFMHQYVLRHYQLLLSFYRFKKRYELLLIPLSSEIGIIVSFKLFVPGGIYEHTTGAAITFIFTLISCALAIHSENNKSFKQPLQQLQDILEEFKSEAQGDIVIANH